MPAFALFEIECDFQCLRFLFVFLFHFCKCEMDKIGSEKLNNARREVIE